MFNKTKQQIVELYRSWDYKEEEIVSHIKEDSEIYMEKIIGRWARQIRFTDNKIVVTTMYLIDGTHKGESNEDKNWGFTTSHL